MPKSSQKGQVLLIIVLIMVIALTVGLALISRSIISLKNTNEQADSQKAFQAAEAGVEIGLQKPITTNEVDIGQKTLDNNAVINGVALHPITGSSIVLNNGNPISQDAGLDIWLTNYPNYSGTPWTGSLYLYWGTNAGCQDAALEAIVISGSSATDPNASIKRYGIDPCGTGSIDASQNRSGQNKFAAAQVGTTVANKSFNFGTNIPITNGLIVRVIPLYTNTPIGIKGFDNQDPPQPKDFPSQGRIITSTGSFNATEREVSFYQGFPLLPSEFFYAVFQP